jgi:hypothetical protein
MAKKTSVASGRSKKEGSGGGKNITSGGRTYGGGTIGGGRKGVYQGGSPDSGTNNGKSLLGKH